MNLEICLEWCRNMKNCNAVNHDNKTDCTWWECPDPVPEPLSKFKNYKGYIIVVNAIGENLLNHHKRKRYFTRAAEP